MKNQETGEFELVLGNRQLLSGFFIVVILFGVFFTMGYIVGRNSAPPARVASAAEVPASGTPAAMPQETAPQPSAGAVPPAPQPMVEPAAAQPGTAPVEPVTAAAQPAAAPAVPAAQPAPELPPVKRAALPGGLIEPAPGDVYLQVMAVKRPEAEVVLKTLKDKGFRAVLGAGPNDLVRVLVGPFPEGGALGQAKAGLENAGFRPIVRK